jgi:hypothetical protein
MDKIRDVNRLETGPGEAAERTRDMLQGVCQGVIYLLDTNSVLEIPPLFSDNLYFMNCIHYVTRMS